MRRTRRTFAYLAAALLLCVLALASSTPYATRTVKAEQGGDPCVDCLVKTQRRFDQCLEQRGENDIRCYDGFNEDIVRCYRSVCEQ